jgi:hypothetical protein
MRRSSEDSARIAILVASSAAIFATVAVTRYAPKVCGFVRLGFEKIKPKFAKKAKPEAKPEPKVAA